MKLISLGKIDKKLLIFLSIYIILYILCGIIYFIFNEFEAEEMNNLELKYIISYGCFIFYGIPEYINRKQISNKKKERKYYKKETNHKDENRIIYLFKFEHKTINIKSLILLLVVLFFFFIVKYGINIYSIYNPEISKLSEQEISDVIETLSIFLICKFVNKTTFYKHQYLSLIIFISMELIRYFIKLFYLNNISFEFHKDLLSLISILISEVLEAIYYFVIKWNMKKNYFSPFIICFLISLVNISVLLILLLIFINIDCGESEICYSLSKIHSISHGVSIVNFILNSILESLKFFLVMVFINYYTILHYFIFILFLNVFIDNVFELMYIFEIFNLTMLIITSLIEIFAIFVFYENIELNFWGLNINLKRNIISRAENDTYLYLDENDEDDDDNNDNNKELMNELDSSKDDNSIY